MGTRRVVWRTHQPKQQEACMWHIEWCRNEGDSFFKRIVAGDYTWMHHCKLESKTQQVEWEYMQYLKLKRFKAQPSACKLMLTTFWDSAMPMPTHFQWKWETVDSVRYNEILWEKLKPATQYKRNKRRNVHITWHWGVFVQSLLEWKCNNCNTNWMCICSHRYAVCNIHLLYCHLWPAPLYNIFPHYLTNDTIFEKKLLRMKCVFWYSLQLFSEKFFIPRRTEWNIKNVYWYSCKLPVILVRF